MTLNRRRYRADSRISALWTTPLLLANIPKTTFDERTSVLRFETRISTGRPCLLTCPSAPVDHMDLLEEPARHSHLRRGICLPLRPLDLIRCPTSNRHQGVWPGDIPRLIFVPMAGSQACLPSPVRHQTRTLHRQAASLLKINGLESLCQPIRSPRPPTIILILVRLHHLILMARMVQSRLGTGLGTRRTTAAGLRIHPRLRLDEAAWLIS